MDQILKAIYFNIVPLGLIAIGSYLFYLFVDYETKRLDDE